MTKVKTMHELMRNSTENISCLVAGNPKCDFTTKRELDVMWSLGRVCKNGKPKENQNYLHLINKNFQESAESKNYSSHGRKCKFLGKFDICTSYVYHLEARGRGIHLPPSQYFLCCGLHGWKWILWASLRLQLAWTGLSLLFCLGLAGCVCCWYILLEFCTVCYMLRPVRLCYLPSSECCLWQRIPGTLQCSLPASGNFLDCVQEDCLVLRCRSDYSGEGTLLRHAGQNTYWQTVLACVRQVCIALFRFTANISIFLALLKMKGKKAWFVYCLFIFQYNRLNINANNININRLNTLV